MVLILGSIIGLIWHTDRGSQYASDSHRQILQQHHIIQSMSRKGNCWDNAVAESFFKTLKCEWIYKHKYQLKSQAELSIFQWIETWYNRKRRHSAIGNRSIEEFELLFNHQTLAA